MFSQSSLQAMVSYKFAFGYYCEIMISRINVLVTAIVLVVILVLASLVIGFRAEQPYGMHNGFQSGRISNGNFTHGGGEINLTEELNNSLRDGFTFNSTVFYSNSSSGCREVLLSACNNNVPSQFACINSNYYQTYLNQRHQLYSNRSYACPMFILAGTSSCESIQDYCVVNYTTG